MPTHEHRQLSDGQRERAVTLIESMAWADLDGSIIDMETALRRAIEATRDDFQRWEQDAEAFGFADEFSLTSETVAELSPEWRLAYVARLLRTVALSYGVSTEFGRPAGSSTLSMPRASRAGVARVTLSRSQRASRWPHQT
jgi:hypothetical protein